MTRENEKSGNGECLERALSQFESNLINSVYAFQDIGIIDPKEQLSQLEKSNGRDISEEDLTKIYASHHEKALQILGESIREFYIIRTSEASRKLDSSSWFAEFLNVSDLGYIHAVLENTPLNYQRTELKSLLEVKNPSTEGLSLLLSRYNLGSIEDLKKEDKMNQNPEQKVDKKYEDPRDQARERDRFNYATLDDKFISIAPKGLRKWIRDKIPHNSSFEHQVYEIHAGINRFLRKVNFPFSALITRKRTKKEIIEIMSETGLTKDDNEAKQLFNKLESYKYPKKIGEYRDWRMNYIPGKEDSYRIGLYLID